MNDADAINTEPAGPTAGQSAVDRVLARLPDARRSGARWMARCPAHADRRPSLSVTRGDSGALLHCFSGCNTDAIVSALGLRLNDLFDGAGQSAAWRPATARPATAREPEAPRRPEGAADLWARCGAAWDSSAARAWLDSRGIDAGRVTDSDLARTLPTDGALPTWATCGRRSWRDSGHRLVVPMRDHMGALASLHARFIGADPGDTPKSLTPAGGSNRGLVMADPLGALVITGEARAWARLTVLIAEGVPDFLTAAAQGSDADEAGSAVLGIVSGSWTRDLAERIPTHARIVVAVDSDAPGEKYAATITETLAGRMVSRWRAAA
ncbi:MAG: toprim domain-containing protein [Vicinamibacteria bacterium]